MGGSPEEKNKEEGETKAYKATAELSGQCLDYAEMLISKGNYGKRNQGGPL